MTHSTPFTAPWLADRLQKALDVRGADELQVSFVGQEVDVLRLAAASLVAAAKTTIGTLAVRAVVGGVEGTATTTDLSDEGVARCGQRAIAQARLSASRSRLNASRSRLLPLGTPITLPEARAIAAAPSWSFDPAVLELDTAAKRAWLEDSFDAHRRDGLDLAGRFNTGRRTLAVRSTRGIDAFHQGTFVDLSLTSLERPAGHRASATRELLDASITRAQVDALLTEVHQECLAAHNPVEIEPGEWDVVLSPTAVASLLGWMSIIGFSSDAVEDGTSFMCGRLGTQITSPHLRLTDDGSMPLGRGLPSPFDAEGTPRGRVELIRDGVANATVHTNLSAARAGVAATGHTVASSLFSPAVAHAAHLHFEGGDASVESLIGSVKRGLFVTRFHYVNGATDPRNAVLTGLLRDAAFLIEEGAMTRAVTPLRFTDSMLEAFGRIPGRSGITSTLFPVAGTHGTDFSFLCPHVLIPALKFTSGRMSA
ncbi:MAG: hypothetical protein CO108_21040 [Deltaproteobacteria bacterium CG_4_9_14_3_um_filter_63_12]|nr:MAG: hypothetical protein CO108_21040 [Deltaproteobacteria bacterium CG_4_9_14_3_um_filter_63_12]